MPPASTRPFIPKLFTPKKCLLALGVAVGMVVATITPAVAVPTSTSVAQPAGPVVSGNVIVVLRNQHTDLAITKGTTSARTKAYRNDQAPVLAKAKSDGARNLHAFDTVNAVAATVTAAQSAQLSADPSVAEVLPDLPISKGPALETTTSAPTTTAPAPIATTPLSGICPTDPSQPLLEPEALGVTNTAFSNTATPQAQNIVNGAGVKVAYIADGIDINNPDFIRADGSHVFIDYQDFSGEGPNAPSGAAEAFGDASAIAAQGRVVYDLANHVNPGHPLPPGCTITIRGMAPGASLIGLKVFGNANTAPTSRFIEAIDYAVTDGADVLNESLATRSLTRATTRSRWPTTQRSRPV
jgi:hypothetical protein